ncbi:hypothetical protein FC093_23100 [Ilyomonas limi]|jgi:hypothetical protein|uniref:Uncharacterized protein n=1 Tax=Ilyomonas limi TaxID=2575867 RepID=A0A4U3KPM1_9BACT|nr:hypothetical protein [Ilyomonas limi]TKK64195.1 hypothetical protein FC093_23100 [Ilyomonas limi]
MMKQYQVYSINDADQFDANDYLTITDEVAFILKQTAGMLPAYKEDIIVSYLKDHAIKNTWITANPLLAKLVSSNVLPTADIEALFDASRNNQTFRTQFEAFLKNKLQATVSS